MMTYSYMHRYSLKVRNYVQLTMGAYYPFISGLGALYVHLTFSRSVSRCTVGHEFISGYYKFKTFRYKSVWHLSRVVFEEKIFPETLEVQGRTSL